MLLLRPPCSEEGLLRIATHLQQSSSLAEAHWRTMVLYLDWVTYASGSVRSSSHGHGSPGTDRRYSHLQLRLGLCIGFAPGNGDDSVILLPSSLASLPSLLIPLLLNVQFLLLLIIER